MSMKDGRGWGHGQQRRGQPLAPAQVPHLRKAGGRQGPGRKSLGPARFPDGLGQTRGELVTRPSPQDHARQGQARSGLCLVHRRLGTALGKRILSANAAGNPRGRLRGCQPGAPRPRVLCRESRCHLHGHRVPPVDPSTWIHVAAVCRRRLPTALGGT